MCNCVRKCVGFPGFPQFVVILPVSALPAILGLTVHCQVIKEHTHEILPLHSCQLTIRVHPISRSFLAAACRSSIVWRLSTGEAFGTAGKARPPVVFHQTSEGVREGRDIL